MNRPVKSRLNAALTFATRHRWMTVSCHTLLVVVACLTLYLSARSMEDQRIQQEFKTECRRVDSRLGENLDVYHEVVQGIASFYAGSDEVSRPEFNAFVHRALRRNNVGRT